MSKPCSRANVFSAISLIRSGSVLDLGGVIPYSNIPDCFDLIFDTNMIAVVMKPQS
jgi:hypothetical protein